MLTVHLLGQFSLNIDDESVELPSRPAQSLLAWLVLHPGIAHRREQIAGLLWPDATEENARNNLRHALWRLRRAIPDGYVQSDRIAIGWATEADWWLDVAQLDFAPGQASRADELLPALHAYAGELLPGFYDEWVIRERERLAALYEERIARLLELLPAEERWREAIDWAERWIAQSHAPEPAYRALMIAQASQGNPSAALAAYQRCVDALERELDVPPSPETTALADAIRNSQFTIHHSQFPTSQSPISNLPAPTTPLIGRESELTALAVLLTDPAHRLVTIVGPGGMGKSRLALAAAHTQRENFADGVFLVELTALTDAAEIPRAVGDALGYPYQNDPRPLGRQILAYLHSRQLLLVLDNFEHLLEGAVWLVEMLEAAPGLRLLVTSRERLHFHAETLFRLEGLACPDGSGAHNPDGYSAVALFVESARRTIRNYALMAEQWPAVARICRMVDGMPLGVILAAGWLEHLPPAEIADEIGASIAFLGQDLNDLEPRHRTMQAVVEQSWQRLNPEDRQVLAGLSVFLGGFDREAARAVTGATLPLLSRLVDRSLLWRVGEGRYDLHELVRQFARQKLAESGRLESLRSLHSRWFVGETARHSDAIKGQIEGEVAQWLEVERENVRSGWQWAAANGEIEGMLAAVEVLGIFYNQPGRWPEGEGLIASALDSLGEGADSQTQLLRLWLLAWHGVFLHRTGQIVAARQQLSDVLESLEASALPTPESRRVQAFALLQRGGDLMTDRQRDETGQDLRRALALYQEAGDHWWTIQCLSALSGWELFNGQLSRAWKLCEEGLPLARQWSYPNGEFVVLTRMSFIAEHMGDNEEGERLAREALAMDNTPSGQMNGLNRLTFALLAVGKFEESMTLVQKAIAWGESIQIHIRGIAFHYNILARAYLHLGRFSKAEAVAQTTVQGWRDAYGFDHPFLVRTLTRALLAQGDSVEARRLLLQTLESHRGVGNENMFPLSGALVDCAYPALALGDLNDTRRTLVEGLGMIQRSEALHFACQSLPAVALLLAKQGRLEEAAFVNGAIQPYPHLTRSCWYAAVALDRLTELLAPLSPDVRSTAEERGREQTLPEMTASLLGIL